jgi:hypothetical protein
MSLCTFENMWVVKDVNCKCKKNVQWLFWGILSRTPWEPVADPLWSADPSLKTAVLNTSVSCHSSHCSVIILVLFRTVLILHVFLLFSFTHFCIWNAFFHFTFILRMFCIILKLFFINTHDIYELSKCTLEWIFLVKYTNILNLFAKYSLCTDS